MTRRSKRTLTTLGKRVAAFMAESGVRGNPKDYVVFVGDQMVDAWGQYTIARPADSNVVALVHKRDLHKIVGDEQAARFWNRRLRRRTNLGAPRGA